MCNIWKKTHDKEEVTLLEIDEFFQKAPYFSWVGITGGEPFLREDLTDIVRVIVSHSKRLHALHFATNGYLTEKIMHSIEEIKKRHKNIFFIFTISIDGPPHVHNFLRGRSEVWERATETFRQLKRLPGVRPQIGYTVSPYNLNQFNHAIESLKKAILGLSSDSINVNMFQKSNFYYENMTIDSVSRSDMHEEILQILKIVKGRVSIMDFLRTVYLIYALDFYNNGLSPVPCKALSSNFFIDPYGDMFPCSIFNTKIGNIKDIHCDLLTLWNNNYVREVSDACRQQRCPRCWNPCDAFSTISGALGKTLRTYVQNYL
jgi:radical SAM protein with 4Fe4S-binding SPASM domain